MYIYLDIYINIYILFIHMKHICIYIHTHIFIHLCIYTYVNAYIHMYIYVDMYLYILCVYNRICAYIYIYIIFFIHTNLGILLAKLLSTCRKHTSECHQMRGLPLDDNNHYFRILRELEAPKFQNPVDMMHRSVY